MFSNKASTCCHCDALRQAETTTAEVNLNPNKLGGKCSDGSGGSRLKIGKLHGQLSKMIQISGFRLIVVQLYLIIKDY